MVVKARLAQTDFRHAFKIGIAGGLALLISQILHLQHPVYAVIPVAVVMQSSLGSSISASFNRILATIIGAIIGAALASTWGNEATYFIALGLGFFLINVICNYAGYIETIATTGIVLGVVMLQHGGEPWTFALDRFLETLLGIIIALAVNYLLWPPHAAYRLRKTLYKLLADFGRLYEFICLAYTSGHYSREQIYEYKQTIEVRMRQLEDLWPEAKKESGGRLFFNDVSEYVVKRIYGHLLTMDQAVQESKDDTFWKEMAYELGDLSRVTRQTFFDLSGAIAVQEPLTITPELYESLEQAQARLDQIERTRGSYYPVAEIMRFFTFFHAIEEIANKLTKLDVLFKSRAMLTKSLELELLKK